MRKNLLFLSVLSLLLTACSNDTEYTEQESKALKTYARDEIALEHVDLPEATQLDEQESVSFSLNEEIFSEEERQGSSEEPSLQ